MKKIVIVSSGISINKILEVLSIFRGHRTITMIQISELMDNYRKGNDISIMVEPEKQELILADLKNCDVDIIIEDC